MVSIDQVGIEVLLIRDASVEGGCVIDLVGSTSAPHIPVNGVRIA
jgi:hypothetical protein